MRTVLSALLAVSLLSFAAGSTQANPEPTDVHRLDLRAGDALLGTIPASGADGRVHDGGPGVPPAGAFLRDGWRLQQTVSKVLTGVSFCTPALGYASAELGGVYKTTNGGTTWTTAMNVGFPYYWYGVHAFDPFQVVVAGFQNQTGAGVIRWSTDGGATWTADIVIDPANWLLGIRFADFDHGIAYGYQGYVYVTRNGGRTAGDWTKVQADPTGGWFAGDFPFWSNLQASITGISYCTTEDGGMTWTRRNSIDPVFDGGTWSYGAYRYTGGGQISTPVSGWVHRSTDGGGTWSGRVLQASYPIRIVYSLDDSPFAIAAGGTRFGNAGGGIWTSTDAGASWALDADTGAEMSGIDSQGVSDDSSDVWCVGFLPSFSGVIYKKRFPIPGMAGLDDPMGHDVRGGAHAAPNPFLGSTRILVPSARDGAHIVDVAGRVVQRLPPAAGVPPALSWDGRDETGRLAPAGVYLFRTGERPGSANGAVVRLIRLE